MAVKIIDKSVRDIVSTESVHVRFDQPLVYPGGSGYQFRKTAGGTAYVTPVEGGEPKEVVDPLEITYTAHNLVLSSPNSARVTVTRAEEDAKLPKLTATKRRPEGEGPTAPKKTSKKKK